MLVPMADNYNHANVNVCPYIVHKSLHAAADPKSKYFNPSKYMNDYTRVMQKENLPRFFNEGKYNENQASVYFDVENALATLRD